MHSSFRACPQSPYYDRDGDDDFDDDDDDDDDGDGGGDDGDGALGASIGRPLAPASAPFKGRLHAPFSRCAGKRPL